MAYVTDVTRLRAGSIVKVAAPLSSSGKRTYSHYFIVLAIPKPPKVGDLISLIGVSSRIGAQSADPSTHLAMKWLGRPGGDPETGFNVPCFACADFALELPIYQGETLALEIAAEFTGKFVRSEKLQTLSAMANAVVRRKKQ